ncbi:hypothetical protein [Mycobacteroides saopaulense]|uniref:DUF3239 domain-containing protein n=1 Tax=Mycobacteroides saopaulense TaxID=1578165 RepID=A0ABX3BWF7_9MYCO|nr:hypothetical protein [Mycobacteroides saopaulense]OHT81192.1 hypothetical protein BKG68_23405 [Mycobacteroides saopaulense]OHU07341.1 hypothetical protein BKG73_19010 [Mycobacteroides saopaulense]
MSFDQPVELRCILDPTSVLKRGIPLLIMAGVVSWLVAAVTLGLMFPSIAAISYIGGFVAAVTVPYLMYTRKHAQLTGQYSEQTRLILSPNGLQRLDHAVAIEIPWNAVDRIETRSSALPSGAMRFIGGPLNAMANAAVDAASTAFAAGIVGAGTLSPLPGASHAILKAHDRNSGSNLRKGQPFQAEQAVIFPSEFESDWTRGTIGAWLRRYRPDIMANV